MPGKRDIIYSGQEGDIWTEIWKTCKRELCGYQKKREQLCEGLVVRASLAYLKNVKEDSQVVRSQDMQVLGRLSRDFAWIFNYLKWYQNKLNLGTNGVLHTF